MCAHLCKKACQFYVLRGFMFVCICVIFNVCAVEKRTVSLCL